MQYGNTDREYMQRCLDLAALAGGYTAPNPMVGAVLVHEGRIIGEGWHRAYGQAHAEVNCFNSVAAADRPLIPHATMYVSLEPCAHYGQTPPCAGRIIQEGVREVVVANRDPFGEVDGKGIALLEQAGVRVRSGCLEAEGAWLNRRFFTFHRQQRPYIILKWAQTANGLFAPADRSRFQISDVWSQRLSHQWRTQEAAIMVGYRTALNDNPQLGNRFWPGKAPLRIAIDKDLQLPATHHLLDGTIPTWILQRGPEKTEGQTVYLSLDFNGDWMTQLMQRLYEARQLSLIVEGGAALLGQFIGRGLWDEARVLTTGAALAEGIAAPVPVQAHHAQQWSLAADVLDLYLKSPSGLPASMGL